MKTIVSDEDIIRTYSTRQQKLTYQYLNVMKILGENKKFKPSKLSKELKIPYTTLRNWIGKKCVPRPIKAINYLKSLKLLPLMEDKNNPKFIVFVRCFAFVFGDGHLGKKCETIQLAGRKEDLENLKIEIEKNLSIKCDLGPHNSEKIYRLDIDNSFFGRLVHAAGAPKGDKTIQKFLLPEWLMKSSKEVKREFLSILFGNELDTPRAQSPYLYTINKISFPVQKSVFLKNNAIRYLNQIRKLLEEFGVDTTSPRGLNNFRIRKRDSCTTQVFTFYIRNNLLNVIKFYTEFTLAYTKNKQDEFDKTMQPMKKHLKEELRKCYLFYKTLKIRNKTNWGCRRIGRFLNFSETTIGHWLRGSKPRYVTKESELLQLLKMLDTMEK